ncbi:MAG TPA: LexA family transcriptional regulator [Cyclobacteriaceae bacterium]|nr:LexA family transcriptional regulator [Cyclobacteriaceae bacterium]
MKKGGHRIAELRELLEFSQKEFAQRIGITQGALSQIESDKSKASFETINKISDEFNVNCNWLIRGSGEVLLPAESSRTESVGATQSDKASIPLIREEAHAGYVNGVKDRSYLSSLDVYQIPGFEKGDYRLFEIVGDSMVPTLHPGEIVVCEFAADSSLIENSSLCVLIYKDGIVAKRVFQYPEKKGSLILKSDNVEYKTQTLRRSKIFEAWLVRAKITTLLSTNGLAIERLEKLESDYQQLKSQVDNLVKNKAK